MKSWYLTPPSIFYLRHLLNLFCGFYDRTQTSLHSVRGSSKINYILISEKVGVSSLSVPDLLMNKAYVTPVSPTISLFIRSNPLDLTNVFILIWASTVLSIVLSPSTAQSVFLSSAAWP